MTDIKQLEPRALWNNFHRITQVPHPSGKKDEIGRFLVDFGRSLGLETLQDESGNVLIRKAATPGMEGRKPVILQAHMDMVPQKNSDVAHDFERDPIDAYVEGEWVKARQTTLGADNGIGLAAALAVLESDNVAHPDLEVFVTTDEETGMYGAFGLQPGFLKGKILLNLDSEDEGELYVGCAGGLDANLTFRYEETPVPADSVAFKVSLTGLKGGHSGMDIVLQRANANKLLFRFLRKAVSERGARLADVDGGSLRNAIPREATAIITVPKDGADELLTLVEECHTLFVDEYRHREDQIQLKAEATALPAGVMPEMVQDDLINAVTACPDGVFRFIDDVEGIVETSNNLATVKSDGTTIELKSLLRSSVESRKKELADMIESVFSLAGAKVGFSGGYPGWSPNLQSPILQTMKRVYLQKFGVEPKVMVIHAGLECGILGRHYPDMDMISFGPTIRHPHSPDEKVHIGSVAKFWEYLTATLAEIPA